jgi:tyrosyl-tRNA synthetase
MGGSDQWGNITAGIDLIRRIEGRAAFGLTLPLVTKGDGSKFGKTESGTIWLDPARTSAYEMYQFWLNTADDDAVRFLKYFTFLPLPRIDELATATRTSPERREAQRVLAREVTALVHGEAAMVEAEGVSAALFGGAGTEALPDGGALPGAVLPPEAATWPLWKIVTKAAEESAAKMSTSEARRLIQQGGVEVDGVRAASIEQQMAPGGHIVKIGKRRIYRVIIEKH